MPGGFVKYIRLMAGLPGWAILAKRKYAQSRGRGAAGPGESGPEGAAVGPARALWDAAPF